VAELSPVVESIVVPDRATTYGSPDVVRMDVETMDEEASDTSPTFWGMMIFRGGTLRAEAVDSTGGAPDKGVSWNLDDDNCIIADGSGGF